MQMPQSLPLSECHLLARCPVDRAAPRRPAAPASHGSLELTVHAMRQLRLRLRRLPGWALPRHRHARPPLCVLPPGPCLPHRRPAEDAVFGPELRLFCADLGGRHEALVACAVQCRATRGAHGPAHVHQYEGPRVAADATAGAAVPCKRNAHGVTHAYQQHRGALCSVVPKCATCTHAAHMHACATQSMHDTTAADACHSCLSLSQRVQREHAGSPLIALPCGLAVSKYCDSSLKIWAMGRRRTPRRESCGIRGTERASKAAHAALSLMASQPRCRTRRRPAARPRRRPPTHLHLALAKRLKGLLPLQLQLLDVQHGGRISRAARALLPSSAAGTVPPFQLDFKTAARFRHGVGRLGAALHGGRPQEQLFGSVPLRLLTGSAGPDAAAPAAGWSLAVLRPVTVPDGAVAQCELRGVSSQVGVQAQRQWVWRSFDACDWSAAQRIDVWSRGRSRRRMAAAAGQVSRPWPRVWAPSAQVGAKASP